MAAPRKEIATDVEFLDERVPLAATAAAPTHLGLDQPHSVQR